jgi:hypothetical protein
LEIVLQVDDPEEATPGHALESKKGARAVTP